MTRRDRRLAIALAIVVAIAILAACGNRRSPANLWLCDPTPSPSDPSGP